MSSDEDAINFEGEDESSESVSDEVVDRYHEEITEANYWTFLERAKTQIAQKNFNDSFDILQALILKGTELFGSHLHVNLAAAYFELGNGYLEMVEQNPERILAPDQPTAQEAVRQTTLLSTIETITEEEAQAQSVQEVQEPSVQDVQESRDQAVSDQAAIARESSSQVAPVEEVGIISQGQLPRERRMEVIEVEGEAEVEGIEEEEVDDIQIAWENLEVSRTILEKYLREQPAVAESEKKKFKLQLANSYLRIGDLKNWQENFEGALEEYEKGLGLITEVEDPTTSRRAAELNFLIGNSHLYNFGKDPEALEKGLKFYKIGRDIIQKVFEGSQEQNKKELEDVLASMNLKVSEVEEELASKQQIFKELAKLEEMKEKKVEGFVKSQFEANLCKKLGKFVGGKKLPTDEIQSPNAKRVNAGPKQSENTEADSQSDKEKK